ncbi:hypothetical protein FOZ61_008225 [Perkinsus olseni]|uniref:Uncharacterized protein n=2 Tax=Perkinsus olseni TaxID=32597 RepID=A0A7J6M7G5_PEROL|nr:hypothetical protein FOZ61_008225 [Perkinsus olseni]
MLELDLVIILSGGLDSDGLPHPWVLNRLDYAADQFNTNTRYFAVADVGMTDEMLFARAAREGESLALLQSEVLPNIKTPEDVHRWIFEEHKAYAFADDGLCVDPKLDRALPDQARATY